jgi:hypothetical protein
MRNQPICTREIVPQSYEGGLGRDSVGRLALALLEPIAGFIAGIPVVADGRVAVAFDGPPPNIHAFDNGFDQQAFS